MTRIVPREMHGEPRYEDEYWADEEPEPVTRWPFLWTVLWVAASVVAVYGLIVGAMAWWM